MKTKALVVAFGAFKVYVNCPRDFIYFVIFACRISPSFPNYVILRLKKE